MNLTQLFSHINRFVSLSPEEERFIGTLVTAVEFKKNDIISSQGKVCKFSNYIVSGCSRVFFTDKNGNEHTVAFGIEDWWTGDLRSFTQNIPADYTIQCLEDSTLVQFSSEQLELIYAKVPKFERFFRLLIQRAYANSQKRLVQNFSLTAKERYLEFSKKNAGLEQRVPQYLIASYLGITKEFMSKLKKEIAHER